MSRSEIDRAVLDWIAGGARAPHDESRFDTLARTIFRYQVEHNPAYRRLCQALGVRPEAVGHWREIPAVPTGAFKEARLATFPEQRQVRTFCTSGTSGGRRGALHLDTLELYEASLRATFGAFVCGGKRRIRLAVLAPPGNEAPDSSLSHMFTVACRDLGTPGSRFYATRAGWDPEEPIADLVRAREPVAVAGTAFAFVHLLDALGPRRLALPKGSRAMETGGFKGRSRELTRGELHARIQEGLGVPPERIVNQYGMCELGSQFYEPTLVTGVPTTAKHVPPWVRTRVVDPATLADVAPGETGILVHVDLVNTGSVLAVQTSDLGRRVPGGFEVLGRAPGAESRGCSIAADLLLGGG